MPNRKPRFLLPVAGNRQMPRCFSLKASPWMPPGTCSSPTRWGGLNAPDGIAVDGARNVYVADSSNNRVLRVDSKGSVVVVIAGTGIAGFSGDGGPATAAQLAGPYDVDVDAVGNAAHAFRLPAIRRLL